MTLPENTCAHPGCAGDPCDKPYLVAPTIPVYAARFRGQDPPLKHDAKAVHVDSSSLYDAFRYALGRRTYAVADVARTLVDHAAGLSAGMRADITEAIHHAVADNAAGAPCDIDEWRGVLKAFAAVEAE